MTNVPDDNESTIEGYTNAEIEAMSDEEIDELIDEALDALEEMTEEEYEVADLEHDYYRYH